MPPSLNISSSSALFLDRDGVINRRKVGGYISHPGEFEFLPGVTQAIQILAGRFNYIFIVTNQQGIGKGLMSEEDLAAVHDLMLHGIADAGGRIDAIYYAPQLKAENSPMRKPDIGMAVLAKEEFPDIDLSESIMVGDSINDLKFGRAMNMYTVFIRTNPDVFPGDLADTRFDDLIGFAKSIEVLDK